MDPIITGWNIRKGDSTPIKKVTLEGVLDYTISGGIEYIGNVAIFDRVSKAPITSVLSISPDPVNGFSVGLYPTYTETVPVGKYIVVFEISGSNAQNVLVYRKELQWELEITDSWLNV